MDLCSVTQGDESRKISFLSTALGVIADLDLGTSPLLSGTVRLRSLADQSWSFLPMLGTEHLRWMGDHRFMYG